MIFKTPALTFASLSILTLLLTGCEGPVKVVNPFQANNDPISDSPPAASQDVRDFEVSLWNSLKARDRCGECHFDGEGGQAPAFADPGNVNNAFSFAVPLVNLQDPSSSRLVSKVAEGHNCWEKFPSVCADSIESMIANWAGESVDTLTARSITLKAPEIKNPGDSKSFPVAPDGFVASIHPLLEQHCSACHYEEGASQQQSPFFANPDQNSAYEAVKPKINIDLPLDSRLVQRLLEGHNCWSDCGELSESSGAVSGDAGQMLAAIEQFANTIAATVIDPTLITSKALVLLQDGIIASGGNRHEANQIALWEFKVGSGATAFDTSGIEPPVNLSLVGSVDWLGAYGLDFSGGKAWADTSKSRKLHDFIRSSGEYTIEAWVIPANVTQQDANILSLDAGSRQKNFALTQTLYSYNLHNRSADDANGEPLLSTADAGEIVQSSLQHVVASYHPVTGRQIYVNGQRVEVSDPLSGSTSLNSWDDSFAFVLGNSSASNRPWSGQIRMAAVHNRVLNATQIEQNLEVGVGQKYFLLFSIGEQIGIDASYIRFEVSQFDSYSYLFKEPTFINLNGDWAPVSFAIQRMRIGINGKQALAGQAFAALDSSLDVDRYDALEGQLLSSRGAVIALEKGADSDEFFLSFELLGGNSRAFVDALPVPPASLADADPVSDIGVRSFDEINASIAKITGIPVTNGALNALFQQYRQQLPTVEAIDAFLSSHQMAIAQLALTSCSERVEADRLLPIGDAGRLFRLFDFSQSAPNAFDTAVKRGHAIDPIIDALLLTDLDSQPDRAEVADLLGADSEQTLTTAIGSYGYDSLITQMSQCPQPGDAHYNEDFPCDPLTDIQTVERTAQIVKAICAAAVGSAAMLIQ